jgi:hypothetical protein
MHVAFQEPSRRARSALSRCHGRQAGRFRRRWGMRRSWRPVMCVTRRRRLWCRGLVFCSCDEETSGVSARGVALDGNLSDGRAARRRRAPQRGPGTGNGARDSWPPAGAFAAPGGAEGGSGGHGSRRRRAGRERRVAGCPGGARPCEHRGSAASHGPPAAFPPQVRRLDRQGMGGLVRRRWHVQPTSLSESAACTPVARAKRTW